ncbi:TlyA family RNA methyltransferase [Leucobacter coleopterorum]|uniref:TlyA family RNA methyltransferase n=1 Tax=Leucobacter coleopterorum TaxID=2714933 RepID=A0ABX6JZ71_9MICO|nr:TlyA family RNA methyltransferase [Leucobacter coleopterorum]QIM18065.1 TlyA family RNA methyltransferase [Leucobacter coleopterorum]
MVAPDTWQEANPETQRSAVWDGETERLDRALPELGLARSRSQASEMILAGKVALNGAIVMKAGAKTVHGSRVEVSLSDHYVSRAAHKLLRALDEFPVDPAGKLALDLGASTGGFTQVLLERGARAVQAIDVGHAQLVSELRKDDRVRVVEGCNARELTAESLTELTGIADAPELVVADLSFISLGLILPAIARVVGSQADVVLLIKPQFEVGRVRDGVVTDPQLRAEAIRIVLRAAAENGFAASALARSPILGGQGNQEYLGHFTRTGGLDPAEWEARITELAAGHFEPDTKSKTNGAA